MSRRIRLIALCTLLTLLTSSLLTAFAEKGKLTYMDLWAGSPFETYVNFDSGESHTKVISIKSGNTSVLKTVKRGIFWWLKSGKAGKATVTVTYTVGKSKKKTFKTTVTVKKYPDPIKKLTVNGKKVHLSSHKYLYKQKKDKKLTGTISVEPKSGWHLKDIYCWGAWGSCFPVRSGQRFKLQKSEDMRVWINLYNDRGENFGYAVDFH